jgi:hypothetical protein
MDNCRQLLRAAYYAFASDACSELGQIALLCVLGLIASLLVSTPENHAFAAIQAFRGHIGAFDP